MTDIGIDCLEKRLATVMEATSMKVPLCLAYKDNCAICPLRAVCGKGQEGSFGKFIRAIQAYCIAGDLLPKSRLLVSADQLNSELKIYKRDSLKRLSLGGKAYNYNGIY